MLGTRRSRRLAQPAVAGGRYRAPGNWRVPALPAVLLLWIVAPATAGTVIVPDQWPTIQEAIDSGAAEILVRPGTYSETPVINRPLSLLGLVPAGISPDSLPVIAGLVFDDLAVGYVYTQYIRITNLRFSMVVQNAYSWNPYSNPFIIAFSRCVFDAGLNDLPATVGGQLEYELRGCRFDGPISLGYPDRVWIDSSLVRHPISMSGNAYRLSWFRLSNSRMSGTGPIGVDITRHAENVIASGNTFEGYEIPLQHFGSGSFEVWNNTFTGPGRYAIHAGSEAYVTGNTIIGYEVGLRQVDVYGNVVAADNRIEHCAIAGISAVAEYIECNRNTIVACGTGAILSASVRVIAEGNVIRLCTADGLSINAGEAQIGTNVVGHCRGDGIAATLNSAHGWPIRLRRNTSYLNSGSGYSLTLSGASIPNEVHHNISYGNGRHGLEVMTSDSLTFTCNDWFGNLLSAVQGIAPSPTDLAVEPLFCDISHDDMHLAAGSPVAESADCGLIGALGIGCSITPVLVDQFMAWRGPDGNVVVGWRIRGDLASQVRVERAEDAQGPWVHVAEEPEADGPLLTIVDQEAESGRAYWYRLIEEDLSAGTQVLAMTFIEASARDGDFALELTRGNLGPGPFTIRFRVPTSATLDLQVFDLQGRRIAQLVSGTWPAGTHVLQWSGRDASGKIQTGVHLLRYSFPGGQATQRLVLIR